MTEKVRAEFRRQGEMGEKSKGHVQNMMQSLNGLAKFSERNVNEVSVNQLKMQVAEERTGASKPRTTL
jgi:hypothetical protein